MLNIQSQNLKKKKKNAGYHYSIFKRRSAAFLAAQYSQTQQTITVLPLSLCVTDNGKVEMPDSLQLLTSLVVLL